MRRIQVEQVKGNEVLARDIYSQNGVIVISKGTKLKSEYKTKLVEMKIRDIFVEDEISKDINNEEFTDEIISELCSEKLRNTIECFANASKNEANKLALVAEGVMNSVLEKKEVLYNVSAVRRKDQSLSDHCLSVAALSILTALNSGYNAEDAKDIAIGALLHDIGFLNIKVEYINMILEEADEEIQKEIKRHVVYGYMNVERQDWLSPVSKDIIIYHHERMDGSGYPFKMTGERIRPEVRLVSICDAFDNMIYGNLCNKLKVYEAIEYITANAGIKFDFDFSKVFVSSVAAYPIGTLIKNNLEETCIVIRQNNNVPTRPVIRVLRKNEFGEYEYTEQVRDLIKELTVFIVDTVEEG